MVGKPLGKILVERIHVGEVDQLRVLINIIASLINPTTPENNGKHLPEKDIDKIQNEELLVACSHTVIDPSTTLQQS